MTTLIPGEDTLESQPFQHLKAKRGGGGGGTATVTEWPTAPPSSTQHHGRPRPKIAGSEGGFIGLVTGLGVLVIVCCGAAWWLLKRRSDRGQPVPKFLAKFMGNKRKRGSNFDGGSSSTMFSRVGGGTPGWGRSKHGYNDLSDEELPVVSSAKSPSGDASAFQGERIYTNDSNPFSSTAQFSMQSGYPGPFNDAFEPRASTDSLDETVLAARDDHGATQSFVRNTSSPLSPSRFKENV